MKKDTFTKFKDLKCDSRDDKVCWTDLTELGDGDPLEDLALEVPEPVGVVHLMAPPGHARHHISDQITG